MKQASKQIHTYVNSKLVISGHQDSNEPHLLYHSVTDTLRSYKTHNGISIFKVQKHLELLKKQCENLSIPFQWEISKLIKDIYQLLILNNHQNALIQVIVSIPITYQFEEEQNSSIAIKTWEWKIPKINNHQKVNFTNIEAPINFNEGKTFQNLYRQFQVKKQNQLDGFDNTLFCDQEGKLIQGINSHLFIENNGVLLTPNAPLAIEGITKMVVKDICKRLEIELIETTLFKEDLMNADSAFLVGTSTEIAGIKEVENKKLPMNWHESLGSSIHMAYKNLVMEQENYEVII